MASYIDLERNIPFRPKSISSLSCTLTCASKFLDACTVHNLKSALRYSCFISSSIPGKPSAMNKKRLFYASFMQVHENISTGEVVFYSIHVKSKDFIVSWSPYSHCKYDTFLLHPCQVRRILHPRIWRCTSCPAIWISIYWFLARLFPWSLILWNNSSRISAIFLVDTPFEYMDTTRSSIPMLRWYLSNKAFWNSLWRSIGTLWSLILLYLIPRSLS